MKKKLCVKGIYIADKITVGVIRGLHRLHKYFVKKTNHKVIDNPDNYQSLLPTEKADKDGKYTNALRVALETPNVNNIAITGSYGSGKSSFLRTFENNNLEWDYLHISLATFKEKKKKDKENTSTVGPGETPHDGNKDDEEIQKKNQLIERSILQQIFYKEKSKNIPQSRFKRIPNIKKPYTILHSLLFGTMTLLYLSILFPEKIKSYFELNKNIFQFVGDYKTLVIVAVFLLTAYYFYKVIQFALTMRVNKLNFKNGEIVVNDKANTSVLNEYLDEILYFFEVKKYDVVVIEDIDRFENSEIFIKLRELNTLINNSKDINRRVVFVYALKDDMFEDKERTKFFDFIIPIIPYINASSSYVKIKQKFEKENLDEEFLNGVSLYIDDMRLLNNIYNEYVIYKHKLKSEKLDTNRLLAMIVYKNFYPEDFANLHFQKGDVYGVFNKKRELIAEKIKKKQNDLNIKKEEIDAINHEWVKTQDELKMIYLCELAQQLSCEYYRLNNQGNYYDLSQLLDDDSFNLLLESNSIYGYVNISTYSTDYRHRKTVDFSVIQNSVDENNTYIERKKLIEDRLNNKKEEITKEIETIKKEIEEIKSYTISELFQDIQDKESGFLEGKKLLQYLIRNSYIKEGYEDYISHFFPGDITEKDREFLLCVKNGEQTDFAYPLEKIKQLIKRLTKRELEKGAVLNFDLLDHLVLNLEEFPSETHALFERFNGKRETEIKFIFEYIERTSLESRMIFLQNIKWPRIWLHIDKKSDFSLEKKRQYFIWFLEALKIDELERLGIKNYLEKLQTTFELNDNLYEKFVELIKAIGVKFECLEPKDSDSGLLEVIYENNLYDINVHMLEVMVQSREEDSSQLGTLQTANMTTLKELEHQILWDYILDNIDKYVENVLLAIENNVEESEEVLIELLNDSTIQVKNKIGLIKKENTKIKLISEIEYKKQVWQALLENHKIEPTWDNLIEYRQKEEEIDQALFTFLNNEDNALELSKSKMNNKDQYGEEILQKFSREILLSEEISNNVYENLVQGIWYWYSSLNFENLLPEKVEILIQRLKLGLTQENIDLLKENFPNKHIGLIEKRSKEFFDDPKKFVLESNDYKLLLMSSDIVSEDKVKLLKIIPLVNFEEDQELVHQVIEVLSKSPVELEEERFDTLFNLAQQTFSLELLLTQISFFGKEKITQCLQRLHEPYNSLSTVGVKPLEFDKTELHERLLMTLDKIDYIASCRPKKDHFKVNRKRK